MQFKAIWSRMPSSTTKVAKPVRFVFLVLDLLRSTLVFLEAGTSSLCTLTLDTDGWTTEVDDASANFIVLIT